MVTTWDNSDEESNDDEDSQKVSSLALMAIGDDKLDKVNDIPTYDKLYDAFKELHNDMMKIGKKNACLKKKMLKLSNENDALHKCNDLINEKIKKLELDNEILHDKIAFLKGK